MGQGRIQSMEMDGRLVSTNVEETGETTRLLTFDDSYHMLVEQDEDVASAYRICRSTEHGIMASEVLLLDVSEASFLETLDRVVSGYSQASPEPRERTNPVHFALWKREVENWLEEFLREFTRQGMVRTKNELSRKLKQLKLEASAREN